MHTNVPEPLKGNGYGSLLAKTGGEYAKSKGYKIAILCPFVSGYLKKHPEYKTMIDRQYHQPERFN